MRKWQPVRRHLRTHIVIISFYLSAKVTERVCVYVRDENEKYGNNERETAYKSVTLARVKKFLRFLSY